MLYYSKPDSVECKRIYSEKPKSQID